MDTHTCMQCGAIPCPYDHDKMNDEGIKDLQFIVDICEEKKRIEMAYEEVWEVAENAEKSRSISSISCSYLRCLHLHWRRHGNSSKYAVLVRSPCVRVIRIELYGPFRLPLHAPTCIQYSLTKRFIIYTYEVRCTVYTMLCTLYTVRCIVYSVQCTVYSVRCTVYSV